MAKVIVYATPVFFLLIAIEYFWSRRLGRTVYRLSDTINSIGLGMMSQFTAVFTRLLRIGIYLAAYQYLSLVPQEQAERFWNSPLGWILALVFYDFCYYWLHRAGHEVAIFWAAHVVHHQSQEYNLSTALRQTSSGALFGWIFYLPMAVAGVPVKVFAIVALVDLLYQFWVHTELVPKLGWFDRWFCSPSNHRVHHAINDKYLDRNYGGIFMCWDRVFGSFIEETDTCIYGTRKPLNSWNPLWANLEVYVQLVQTSWRTRRFTDKLRVFLKPPGWLPPDLRHEGKAYAPPERFDPVTSPRTRLIAGMLYLILLGSVSWFLWVAETLTWTQQTGVVSLLLAGLWIVGALLQGRLKIPA